MSFIIFETTGRGLFIAWLRFRRGRPKGVPLRAEGFPKRRCHFESVAAQRHLSPRRSQIAKPCHIEPVGIWPIDGRQRRPLFAGRNSQFAKSCHIDSSSVWPIVRGGPPFGTAPTQAPVGVFFYEPRVTRGDVVALSLSRRNAASESEADCDRRPADCKKGAVLRQLLFSYKLILIR